MNEEKGSRMPNRGIVTVALLGLYLCVVAGTASAAPVHAPLPDPVQGFPLNKACGTAVDSEGDIYVASAGSDKIEVFAPGGEHLGSIADGDGPCSLAVDSKGNVYASDQSTGNVVKFVPTSYPFAGAPTYGPPVTVVSTGDAEGIAVDPADDRLYVAEGGHVSTYGPDGTLGISEVQRVLVMEATSGTYTLSFEEQETPPLPYSATDAEVQAALEGLSTVGAGNVELTPGPNGETDHLVAFVGALSSKDVDDLIADPAGLEGAGSKVVIEERVKGYDGHIGEDDLTNATAVTAYTYGTIKRPYISIADSTTDRIEIFSGSTIRELEHIGTVDGSETPSGALGFGAQGAALGVDQLTGHVFAYDDDHDVLLEFQASGRYFTQIADPALTDAGPSGISVDRSGGANDGNVYVSAGSGPGAKLLAFGPVTSPSRPPYATPSRAPSPDLSIPAKSTCGVAVDSTGNVYVASGASIKVYSPTHALLATITSPEMLTPCSLAVDSQGVLYAIDLGSFQSKDEEVLKFRPDVYPLTSSPTYSAPQSVDHSWEPNGIAVSPVTGHLLVVPSGSAFIREYASDSQGSALLASAFGSKVLTNDFTSSDIAYDFKGDVYVNARLPGGSSSRVIAVLDPSGDNLLSVVDGSGTPGVSLAPLVEKPRISIDRSTGDIVLFSAGGGSYPASIQEYEPSGAFVTSPPNGFVAAPFEIGDIAVDNSGGPNDGTVYVAFRNEVTAFGPLLYSEPPAVETRPAQEVGGGKATLHGTVDPRGIPLTACEFEYLPEEDYKANGSDFSGAATAPCVPDAAGIGSGSNPVSVETEVAGLDPEARYRYRIVATNQFEAQFGPGLGAAGLFGPPLLTTKAAQPISYAEATIRAAFDPSGLSSTYRVEYGTSTAYGNLTPLGGISAGDGSIDIDVPLFSLAEGTEYHYRVIVENEAGSVVGPDQTLQTLSRPPAQSCPNAVLRAGNNSLALADCRAYELVTPADLRGARPFNFGNGWVVDASGPSAGESVSFWIEGATLPGTDGNGIHDYFRSTRGSGGWDLARSGPDHVQSDGRDLSNGRDGSPDQEYFFAFFGGDSLPGALPQAKYLGTPDGFEPVGLGSLGTDPLAQGRLISPGGTHVIFSTGSESEPVQLEPDAPAPPVGAIYDRSPGGPTHVVSLPPDGASPAVQAEFETVSPQYQGATEDGSAVVFELGGVLYLRSAGATVKVADGPVTYAGISDDGGRVFYANADFAEASAPPADLFAFDVENGTASEIAAQARFVNVSGDGSRVYLTSTEVLDEADAGTFGAHNLYLWDGTSTRLVAVLDPEDVDPDGFPTSGFRVGIGRWAAPEVVGPKANGITGIASEPSRSTPDGSVLVFQSHANLTSYDSEGHSAIYLYDAAFDGGQGRLLCVSCDPSGSPPTGDSSLQVFGNAFGSPVDAKVRMANVTDDGRRVFFVSEDALRPEDGNTARDVYEWRAQGVTGCDRAGGCLSLISSGQSDKDSFLYGMSDDGRDVFFLTMERLIGADVAGSASIYDARIGGGFAAPSAKAPCSGDACQGTGSAPPALPGAASAAFTGPGNVVPKGSRPRCGKGKARRNGRCVKKAAKKSKKRSPNRANADRRTDR